MNEWKGLVVHVLRNRIEPHFNESRPRMMIMAWHGISCVNLPLLVGFEVFIFLST